MTIAQTPPPTAEGEEHAHQSLVYSHVVADARRVLTLVEIGDIVGVGERAVQKWAAGTARPEGPKRDRLLEIQYIVGELADVYKPEGVEIWLHSPQRLLGGRRPVDALKSSDFELVLRLVHRLAGGPKVR